MSFSSPEAINARRLLQDQIDLVKILNKRENQRNIACCGAVLAPWICVGLFCLAYRFLPLLLQSK